MKRLFNCVIAVLLTSAVAISASYAQNDRDDDEQRWFQVELFVFANTDPSGELSELWPDDLGLQYPEQLYQLLDQVPLTENSEGTDGDQIDTDANPDQEDNPKASGPKAFLKLPADQHQLTDIVKRISARRNYRFLMHESWLQPMQTRDTSIPILIRAGEQFDEHFELEGSIKISVERYLHIYTDLWLSRFINKDNVADVLWPALPTPPKRILNAEQDESISALVVSIDGSASSSATNSFSSGDLSFTDLNQATIDSSAATAPLLATIDTGKTFDNNFQSYQSFFDFEQRYFRAERTATMRQNRRMRSNELHYIDHPLMGLLIKIMPYEPPPEPDEDPTEETTASNKDAPAPTQLNGV